MALLARRSFLQQSRQARPVPPSCCSVAIYLRKLHLRTQLATVRLYFDTKRTIASIDRNIFGSFLEHLGLGNNITSAGCALSMRESTIPAQSSPTLLIMGSEKMSWKKSIRSESR